MWFQQQTINPALKEWSGQYSVLIQIHKVTGNCKICFKNYFDLFYRYIISIISSSQIACDVMCVNMYESSHRRCSLKKDVLKNFDNSQENTCIGVSF